MNQYFDNGSSKNRLEFNSTPHTFWFDSMHLPPLSSSIHFFFTLFNSFMGSVNSLRFSTMRAFWHDPRNAWLMFQRITEFFPIIFVSSLLFDRPFGVIFHIFFFLVSSKLKRQKLNQIPTPLIIYSFNSNQTFDQDASLHLLPAQIIFWCLYFMHMRMNEKWQMPRNGSCSNFCCWTFNI